jgi:hypothetical protein
MGKRKERRGAGCSKLGRKLTGLDIYGEDVGFTMNDGDRTHGSWFGLFATLIVTLLTVAYLLKRLGDLNTNQETTYLQYSEPQGAVNMTFNMTEHDWFYAGFLISSRFKTPLDIEALTNGSVFSMYAVHLK